MGKKQSYDSTKLLAGQREAAVLVTEFQFTKKGEREFETLDDIAFHLGITRMTLYRWRTKDENFIALVNDLGERYMSTKVNDVYSTLVNTAVDGNTKSIEMFLKNRGLLADRVELSDGTKDDSVKDRTEELEKRMAALLDGKDAQDESDGVDSEKPTDDA